MFRTGRFRFAAAATVIAAAVAGGIGGGGIGGGVARAGEAVSGHGYGQAQLQRDLDAIRDLGVPGVLAEVDIGGRRLRGASGVADVEAGGPVDPGGYFRMGSNTKTFVAVVVLQLVAERRLSLDDAVERWLPGVVTGNGNDGRAITVRQLLQHTSGLFDYTNDLLERITSEETYREFQFTTFTPGELVAMALRHPPGFAPGTGYAYSNTNYVLLGQIIERVAGRGWAREVDDRIARPLGLRHTAAPGVRTRLPDPHASGYVFLGPDLRMETSDASLTWADAAGALYTTAADLSRFWGAIGRGTLLRPAEREQMRRTVPAGDEERPGVRYGLGIEWAPLTCGGGYWTHGGDVPGYTTVNGVSADGRTTVVISLSVSVDDHGPAWSMVDRVMCSRR
jgi:D-alanyl-D-alanine carboxypeptidase